MMNIAHEGIQKPQSVGWAVQEEHIKSIPFTKYAVAWKQLRSLKEGGVDLVLDNGVSGSTDKNNQYKMGFEVAEYSLRSC